jgi:hypothetical protein
MIPTFGVQFSLSRTIRAISRTKGIQKDSKETKRIQTDSKEPSHGPKGFKRVIESHLDSASRVQAIIRQLDEVSCRDTETYLSLEFAIRTIAARRQLDPRLKAIDGLDRTRGMIEQVRGRAESVRLWGKQFQGLLQVLRFRVRSIRQGMGTVSLPWPAPLVAVTDAVEAHVRSVEQIRRRRLDAEIDEICEYLPYTTYNGSRVVVIFGNLRGEARFQVVFGIPKGYPWAKLRPETTVQLGNEQTITAKVAAVCRTTPPGRMPLLEVCQRIAVECRTAV